LHTPGNRRSHQARRVTVSERGHAKARAISCDTVDMQYPFIALAVCLAACGPVTINVSDLPDLPGLPMAGGAAPAPSEPAPSLPAPSRARAIAAPVEVTLTEGDAGVDEVDTDDAGASEPAPTEPEPTTPDAGTPDAGASEPDTDAGTLDDAGAPETDAGPPPPPPRCVLDSGQVVICDATLPHWHPDWTLSWTVTFSEVHHGTSVDWTGATYRCDPRIAQTCDKGTVCTLSITGAPIQWGKCQ
jgi:hypothetical protein